jgi:hypothetical protein
MNTILSWSREASTKLMPTFRFCLYGSHHVFCLCAVTPNANDLHGEGGSRDDCLDALGQPPPLDRLPDLLAVDVVTLCFQIYSCSSLIGAATEGNEVVDSWAGGQGAY